MKARMFTGGAMVALGMSLLTAALCFINGPFFYLSPFAFPVEAIQINGLGVGTTSLLIGLIVIASTRSRGASAKRPERR